MAYSSRAQAIYRRRGLLCAFLCAVFIAVQDLFVKLALDNSISAYQVTSLRASVLCMCSIPTIIVSPNGRYLKQETVDNFKLLIARSLFASASTLLVILAFSYTDMGSATAIFNSMPVFSGIIGWILLRERFTTLEVVLSALSLVGVSLIAQPQFIFHRNQHGAAGDNSHLVGAAIALTSAVVTAVSFVLSRKLSQHNVHPIVNMFYFGLVSVVSSITLTTLLQEWTIPECGILRLYLILVGLFNFIVQSLLIKSLDLEKPVVVTVTLTLNILFAFLVQFVFLGVKPDVMSAIGAGMIFVSSVAIALSRSKNHVERPVEREDDHNPNGNC